MALILFLTFITVPLLEIGVFIEVGGRIGTWPTVGIVILTAIIGTWMIRLQGLSVLARAQQALEQDRLPVTEIFDGLCLLIAGALLLTPGFVTDTVGFALLLPPVRLWAGRWIWRVLQARGGITIVGRAAHRRSPEDDTIIDGEYREVTPDDDTPPRDPPDPDQRRLR
ncbi:MAG: FxsA family protein [Alphaproteobacteria bacterium]|nr:FxsA family protein [Alphaproteobacteria bacterium]